MMSDDLSGAGSLFCAEDVSAGVRPPATAVSAGFQSILVEQPGRGVGEADEPDFFGDLHLDQVLESIIAGREQYDLKSFFYVPLHEVDAVRYRHEVFRDLQKADVTEAVTSFADAMRSMREHLAKVENLHYQLQKQSWFLDAIDIYCKAVRALAEELPACDVTSRGLRRFRGYLAEYAGSARFTSLAAETHEFKDALARIQYSIRIHGPRVTVSRYEGEPDYGAEVAETFAKFRQGAVKSYLVKVHELAEMDHVEAQIAGLLAKLYPEAVGSLGDYCAGHRDYLDPAIGRFDREVQFYLAYLDVVRRFSDAGLPFCYPQVSASSKEITAEATFDIALAGKLVPQGGTVVGNGFHLTGPERIFVVSGPNNGGKTTFARTFGQLHYLASLGLLIPGRQARIFLPDRIFTHFEKEEDIETLRGKFDEELVRVRGILDQATCDSVIVMNESFNSTSLSDALFVGTEVMRQILGLGCLGVYVTFVDEIASLSEATVSMVSQVVPENPAERTFKIVRKHADGRAYAWAIAEKYGLSYERLMERIGA